MSMEKETYQSINKYTPATKEWNNSIYSYNNINNKLILYKNNIVSYLFSIYMNLQYLKVLNRKFRKRRIKLKNRSSKKAFLSTPEIKHTNSKVIFTTYIYNTNQIASRYNLIKYLKNLRYNRKSIILFKKLIKKIKKIYILYYNLNLFIYKTKKVNNNYSLTNIFLLFLKKKAIFKYLKKVLYTNQVWLIEKKKSNNLFLDFNSFGVISLLKKIYGKNIEVDIINHKAYYLSSDILSKSITSILRNRKINYKKVLSQLINKKLPDRYLYLIENNKETLSKNVLDNLKYKAVTGIRFNISGRLTRRLTAMRSVNKLVYKGSVKNTDSSFKGLSTYMVRNNINCNLQFTRINGKTRNGAFGLKCWINSN